MSTPTARPHRVGLPLFLAVLILVAGCSDDDPATPGTGADINGVVSLPSGQPAAKAPVYLTRTSGFFPVLAPVFMYSTVTSDDGLYEFDGLASGTYQVFAGVHDAGKAAFELVSPFSEGLEIPYEEGSGKGANHVTDLQLLAVTTDGEVTGEVYYEGGDLPAPVDSATVTLWEYVGMGLGQAGETLSDEKGSYGMTGVATGNYSVHALKIFEIEAPFPVYVSGETEAFFCDGKSAVVAPTLLLTDAMVEKPAVYIYPETPGPFTVNLDLNHGSRLAASEPDYGDGWRVDVAADGLIDGRWDYLFYEVAIRAWPLLEMGWCLPREDLASGLAGIVTDFGLTASERADFLDYWTTRLPRHDWYVVKPVVGDHLETWVGLDVVPAPDSVIRFWLFFEGSSGRVAITPPSMPRVARTGTTVVEWGGAVIPSRDF